MAAYVEIVRTQQSAAWNSYSYSEDGGMSGVVEINAETGDTRPAPEQVDPGQRRALMMASTRLRKHWQAGELPARTAWAS